MTRKIAALSCAALALALGGIAQTPDARAAGTSTQTSSNVVVLDTITLRSSTGTGPLNGLAPTDSTTGTKTATPLRETPQAISVVGAKQIERQGAQTVGQALAYSGGITSGTAGTQSRYDALFIRGFGGFGSASLFADYLDGLNIMRDGQMSTQVDPWLLERV